MNDQLRFSSAGTMRTLFIGLFFLFFMHFVVVFGHLSLGRPFAGLTELFDVDQEGNLPAMFNALLFFFGALCFFFIGRAEKDSKERRPWYLMAFVFTFLGFDEGSQIHEKFFLLTHRVMEFMGIADVQTGWLYYAWYIPYGIAALGLLAILFPWLKRISAKLRLGLLVSGAVYLFGAIFMEAWSGKVAEALEATYRPAEELTWLPCFIYHTGTCFLYDDAAYVTLYSIEEFCEMTGLIFCIAVLLKELERRGTTLQLSFSRNKA